MTTAAPELRVRVAAKTVEAQDICSFELVPIDRATLPAFTAGAHIEVHLGDGLVRPYSLCNAPHETHRYVIAVLRDAASRGGSQALHTRVQVGSELLVSTPRNHFALAAHAKHSVLLAGGIGVTPLMCMAEALAAQSASFVLHYCSRSPERTAFVDRLKASAFGDRVHLHFDDGPGAQHLDMWELLSYPQEEQHLYVCGPQGFIELARSAAREAQWPQDHVHFEYFGGQADKQCSPGSFEIEIAGSGQVIAVAADQTVVQALHAAGFDIPTACEQGLCGTCLTRVVASLPDHRDVYLSPQERAANDQFLPCCSRALSPRLVLAL